MRTTIRDVAKASGVSAMAVSAVLNGSGSNVKVSPQTAARIQEAARNMRYRPNSVARSLRNRSTKMIAVVFQHFDRLGEEQPYYPQLLNGVMSALFPEQYTLALCPRLIQSSDVNSVSDGRFDGVLWCRPDLTHDYVEGIQNSNVPVVMMHAPPGAVPGVPTFCADNDSAMRSAVKHLVDLGHSKLVFAIDAINEHTVEGISRREAYFAAVREQGLSEEMVIWEDDSPAIQSYRVPNAPHTGIVCFSDTVAGLILRSLDQAGVSVPGAISVIGFDSSPFCDGTSPRLTSLNQPVERMARAATVHLLLLIRQSLEGIPASPVGSYIYDCGLDVRESTGPPCTHS